MTPSLLRNVVGLVTCVALGCAPDAANEVELPDEYVVVEGDALVDGPTCAGATICTTSRAVPQCLAAALEGSFGFEGYQFIEVPSPGTYSFIRLVLKRLSPRTDGVFQAELRELPAGSVSIEASTLVVSATATGSLIPRFNTAVTLRFPSPVTLAPATGGTPRYVLVFRVTGGTSLSVGIGCAGNGDELAGVTAGGRKLRKVGESYVAGSWSLLRRDVALALGQDSGTAGPCATMSGATCDDGNGVSGDGCSASCQVEAGFSCAGLPSACTDVDECAANTDTCAPTETCTNTPGSFTCAVASATDCNALKAQGVSTGFQTIDPDGAGGVAPFTTHCEMGTAGGGWTLVELRSRTVTSTTSASGITALDQYPTALSDAAWVAMRDRSAKVLLVAEDGTVGATLDIAKMKSANCVSLPSTLTSDKLAHAENSGCDANQVDYCIFGWTARRTALYNFCAVNFFDSFPLASNAPDTAFPPFWWEPTRMRVYVR